MMTYDAMMKRMFNRSLYTVEDTNRKLLELYRKHLARLKKQIAEISITVEGPDGLVVAASAHRKKMRLSAIYNQIDAEIRELQGHVARRISAGFQENYVETYYSQAFGIEREINIGGGLASPKYDYFIDYPLLDTKAIKAALTERIAGETFLDRMAADRTALQWRVRQNVADAIVEGIPVRELQKRLEKGMADAYGAGSANAQATARTELLRAHSLGQEEAVDVAEDAGVEMTYSWSSTLDGHTRASHGAADGQKAKYDSNGERYFTVGGAKLTSPRVGYQGSAPAAEVVNCRCRMIAIPYDITPAERLAKTPNGTWRKVNGGLTYDEWRKTKEGRKVIDSET